MMKITSEIDDFIKRRKDGDLVILPKANKIIFDGAVRKEDSMLNRKVKKNLADALACSIADYQFYKRTHPNTKLYVHAALECLDLIERAYAHGVIEDKGVTNKIKALELENRQLKEEKDKLQEKIIRLEQLNEALHQTIDRLGARRPSNLSEE